MSQILAGLEHVHYLQVYSRLYLMIIHRNEPLMLYDR